MRYGHAQIPGGSRAKKNMRSWSLTIAPVLQPNTTMRPVPRLPPELVDSIIDFLRHDREALKRCRLVSKSWVPRTRLYLFEHVIIEHPVYLRKWKEYLPDPANSPFTRALSLSIPNAEEFSNEDVSWIRSQFTNLVQLEVLVCDKYYWGRRSQVYALFHGLSPNIKSLNLGLIDSTPEVLLNFICSFPLLEDLQLGVVGSGWTRVPCKLPILPISLKALALHDHGGHSGAHYLMKMFSGTLERIYIRCRTSADCHVQSLIGFPFAALNAVDLSIMEKLKEVKLRFYQDNPAQVVETLGTITSRHKDLERVSIYCHSGPIGAKWGLETRSQWKPLDLALVKLRSHPNRVKVVIWVGNIGHRFPDGLVRGLLPEVGERGISIHLESDKRLGTRSEPPCFLRLLR